MPRTNFNFAMLDIPIGIHTRLPRQKAHHLLRRQPNTTTGNIPDQKGKRRQPEIYEPDNGNRACDGKNTPK